MSVSAIDSRIFRDQFGTHEARCCFDDSSYAACMIQVEQALARAQSALNIIPPDVGRVLTETLHVSKLE